MKMTAKYAALVATALTLGTMAPSLSAVERASLKGRVAATQQASFDIFLPPQHRAELDKLLVDLQAPGSASYHKFLTPVEFNSRFGVSSQQVEAIKRQLAAYGLVADVQRGSYIHVTGSARDIEEAFTTELQSAQFADGKTKVVATRPIVPLSALAEVNAVVTGLSPSVRMRTHARPKVLPDNRYSFRGAYWFDDLKQAYSFPSYQTYTGKGATVGILIDADFQASDIAAYFAHEKLATPSFTSVPVNGGSPYTGINGDSFETHLDMEQSGGMAPNANFLVYVMNDLSDDSIMRGLAQIIAENRTDIVSMSFGGGEVYYTAPYSLLFEGVANTDFTYLLQVEDALFAQGTAQGITFIASSGDSGALEGLPVACFNGAPSCGRAFPTANFPASSPNVVGVGGTNLQTSYAPPSLNSTYQSEVAYADPLTQDIFFGTTATGQYWGSGGGNSVIFKKPAFQSAVPLDEPVYRTVPDIALQMGGCPGGAICQFGDSAVYEAIDGKYYGAIGTSASAPEFAGLMALAFERFGGRQGNANYYIYNLAAQQRAGTVTGVFRLNIEGYNGVYLTEPRYNRVLGNGTVNGVNFLSAPSTPVAGTPQTVTNP